jgi:hypothetical protein
VHNNIYSGKYYYRDRIKREREMDRAFGTSERNKYKILVE